MSIPGGVLACLASLALAGGAHQLPPNQPLAPLPLLPVTQLDDRGLAAELDAPRRVSLTFARPLPIRDVLLLLFRGTPFSVVFAPGTAGTFAGELKDVTLRQALESVLHPAGVDYDADGSIVLVSPRRLQTRLFNVDHLYTPRASVDFFAEIGAGVQSLLSGSGKSHVNRKASLIQVTDFADRLDLVGVYLDAAHLRVNRQVRIEARVFEVTHAGAAPVDWSALASRPGSGVRRAPDAAAGWRIDDFDAWLRTIGEIGAVRHVAAPALLAMNNEPAMLRADDPTAQSRLRLAVTPQIAADGIIHLHVAPSYGDGQVVAAAAGEAGRQFTASVDTVVRIADGDTVLISGLMRRLEAASHAELVVLLTARTTAPAAGGR